MYKRVKRIAPVLMGTFSIISLIRNETPKITTRVTPKVNIQVKTDEIRNGGEYEGIILMGNGLRNIKLKSKY